MGRNDNKKKNNLWKQPYAWDKNNIGSFLANEHEATNEFLSEMLEQNLEHARHIENERLTYCTCITALVAGYLAFFAESDELPAVVSTVFCALVHIATAFSFNLNERWTYGYGRHMEYAKGCYYILYRRVMRKKRICAHMKNDVSMSKSCLFEDGSIIHMHSEKYKIYSSDGEDRILVESGHYCSDDNGDVTFSPDYRSSSMFSEVKYEDEDIRISIGSEVITNLTNNICKNAPAYYKESFSMEKGKHLEDVSKILPLYSFGINSTKIGGVYEKISTKIYFRIYYIVLYVVMTLTLMGSVYEIDPLLNSFFQWIVIAYLFVIFYWIYIRPFGGYIKKKWTILSEIIKRIGAERGIFNVLFLSVILLIWLLDIKDDVVKIVISLMCLVYIVLLNWECINKENRWIFIFGGVVVVILFMLYLNRIKLADLFFIMFGGIECENKINCCGLR